MKKLSIQIKLGVLLILAVVLLSATCYLSYRNLSSIVSSIRVELTPELRLACINDISRDLETADNRIRIYTISRDTSDLGIYYVIINGIDDKINKLKMECSDDTIMLSQVDTISTLIEENIVNWNELLYLIDSDNVIDFLNRLADQLKDVPVENEKKGILKRVFNRNRKNILNEQDLKNNIQKIEEEGRITKEKLKAGEEQLALTSRRIKEKLFGLITRMESQVARAISEKGEAANQLAERTYLWLVLFSVSGGLLALLVLYIIVRYIKNARAYQDILEKSRSEAEDLIRTKELFMANISHEIRTPVTAISGFTEQLLHETTDENALRSLKIIKSSSDHLAKIIDDILDLSKLNNGRLVLEKVHFSISQILNEVYTIFEKQAKQNNTSLSFTIKPDTPPVLMGDPYRLKQILMNLVGNSVKFTESGSVGFSVEGIINISGEVDLVVEVIDTGIGIDESKLNIIFEDFTQAEMNTTRKYGGTGLGLSIVKKLVELHGGNIECESKRNHGTRITCHLPFRAGIEDQIKRDVSLPLTIPEEIKSLSILVVDDEEYNRLLFRKILKKWKIKCDEASSGMDAIEMLKDRRYDLIFMDIRMPGMDGIEVTHFIRNELKVTENDMQVICISALSMNEGLTKYRQAGMNAFLQKPFTEEMLLVTILSVMGVVPDAIPEETGKAEKSKPSGNQKINLNNLFHISGGDDQFVKQMLLSFNLTTQKGLKEMKEAVSSGQWETAANLAHKMLPPCRHIGADDLHKLLGKIEESVSKRADKQSVESLLTRALAEFEAVSELVNEYISKLK